MLVWHRCHDNQEPVSKNVRASAIPAMDDFALPCIWQPFQQHATIQSLSASTTVYARKGNRPRSRVAQRHANCCTWPLPSPPPRRTLIRTINQRASHKGRERNRCEGILFQTNRPRACDELTDPPTQMEKESRRLIKHPWELEARSGCDPVAHARSAEQAMPPGPTLDRAG
jgi:hypothetical protein